MSLSTCGADVAPLINEKLVKEYYSAVRCAVCGEYGAMKQFQRLHPLEYKRFSAVHRKRTRIKNCVAAMKVISEEVYFGTLTFNERKNSNKRESKRKEAFKKLNALFEYVLLVEELGEENGRYHVHFLGTFKLDHNFQDFKRIWHSRQNLRRLQDNLNVAQYMCKYLCKDLPRIRCNRPLVRLEKEYKRGVYFGNLGFECLNEEQRCKEVHFLNALDFD